MFRIKSLFIALAIIISFQGQADQKKPLKSNHVRNQICQRLATDVFDLSKETVVKAKEFINSCRKSKTSFVATPVLEPTLKMYSWLDIDFNYTFENKLTAKGTVRAYRKFRATARGKNKGKLRGAGWWITQLKVKDREDKRDIRDLVRFVAENINTGNGSGYDDRFDAKNFNYDQVSEDWMEGIGKHNDEQGDCVFEQEANTDSVMNDLVTNYEPDGHEEVGNLLKGWHNEGRVLAAFSNKWDEFSGDSEYCSLWQFTIYLKDGYVLYLDYDSTT